MRTPDVLRHVTVLATIPVDPDAPTARRWLDDELANPIYHEGPTLIERILTWISERLDALLAAGSSISPLTLVIAVAIVAALIAVAVWIAGPARLRSAPLTAGALAAADDTRSSEQMRSASDAASAAGDLTTAVVERFRAIVRSAEERVVLTELPGRTADEAASELGAAYPSLEPRVRSAARLFDDTLYGERPANARHLADLTDLDTTLGTTRPVPSAERAVVIGRLR